MEHEQEQGHDLDFAIRRECLRLEKLRSIGVAEPEAEVDLDEDPGLTRWNAAVKKGGVALMTARDKARVALDAEAEDVAARPLRPARWVDSDSDEEEEECNKGAGQNGEDDKEETTVERASESAARQRRLAQLHEVWILQVQLSVVGCATQRLPLELATVRPVPV